MDTRGIIKTKVGTVVSTGMDKTVVVAVERRVKHPRYKKYIRRKKKYLAHDEEGLSRVGDQVKIVETRPLSRRKRHRLLSIIKKAPV
jgi:small subunit ribosomal protein S17